MVAFAGPVDLMRNELRNSVTQNLGTAPASPLAGLRYYDSVLNFERYWNGTRWVSVSDTLDASNITGLGALAYLDQAGTAEIIPGAVTDAQVSATAAIALSKLAVDPLARANHTGTQLAATVSDFDLQVRTSRLDQMAIPTATIDLGGQVLTNLADPVLASDATNKSYVDSIASGIQVHQAVRVASTANVAVAAPGAGVDGVTLVNGDRVLLKDQTNGTQNGIYDFNGAGTALTRSSDADQDAEVVSGLYVLVTEGNTNAHAGWLLSTPNPIQVGTTVQTWSLFSSGGQTYTGTTDRISIIGTQIDIASTYAGQPSLTTLGTVTTGTWGATPIDLAHGGTGATTAAQARVNLQTIGKYSQTIGDGTTATFAITHGLGTKAVGVEVYDVASGSTVYIDVARPDNNTVTIDGFGTPPGPNALNVIVWG
jgi:hypothetical protein